MGSGGGGGRSSTGLAGKKRKAAGGRGDLPERHESRRGLGVAALESLMAARLETAKNFYMFPPPPPPPPPLPPLIGYVPGARFNPYVGNEVLQRDYYQQHYGAEQQYYTSDVFARILQASSGHVVPCQSHQQVDQSAGVVMAAPPPLLQEHDHHRQAQAQHQQHRLLEHDHHHRQAQAQHHHGQTRRPQVTIVDLVDEDDSGAGEELDLELRL